MSLTLLYEFLRQQHSKMPRLGLVALYFHSQASISSLLRKILSTTPIVTQYPQYVFPHTFTYQSRRNFVDLTSIPAMSTKTKKPAAKTSRSAIADVVAREYTIHLHK